MDPFKVLEGQYRLPIYVAAPFAALALLLSLIRAYTTWSYYQSLRQFDEQPSAGKRSVQPPQIPYTLPFFGNTFSFLRPYPGQYWAELFQWHPRSTGVCTLLIGGRKTHFLFSPPAVQALFKARSPSRDVLERDLFKLVFDLSDDQIHQAHATKHSEEQLNVQYLTKHERVNELTAHFTESLGEVLEKDAQGIAEMGEVGIYDWLRDRMFTTSTNTLLGEKLLQMYPTYREDFFKFDNEFMSFFFQLPRFLMGEAYTRRRRILDNLVKWSEEMHRLNGGAPVDPDGPAWEPLFGSRLNRARHIDYKHRNFTPKTAAALDLGLTFAISSNAIPATGWMLMHILDPNGDATLLPRVLVELHKAEKPDGTLDIPILVSQPLLQSIWSETLRLYVDALVTRNLPEDLTLPLDDDGKKVVTFRKGDNVFAPSWLGGHDAAVWSARAPYDQFCAERFLSTDPETGVESFSMNGTVGKYFPFGGGKTICPGRVFAKQEAMGALAMVLLRFDFDVKGFLDAERKPSDKFPRFAKAFAGSGALVPGGDLKVRIRRRER